MAKHEKKSPKIERDGVGQWGASPAGYIAGSVALEACDQVARRLEAHWGCGRLPRVLIGAGLTELAAKFYSQQAKLNAAIWHGELHEVELHAGRMRAAWETCHRRALEAGCSPIEPTVWEITLKDGRVLAVALDGDSAAAHARACVEGRGIVIWTLQEVASMVDGEHWVNDVKREFPGATVQRVRPAGNPLDALRGDEISF